MVHDLKIQQIPNHNLDVVDSRIAKLNDLVAFSTDKVVMLFIAIRLFKLSLVSAKLVLANQVAFYQKVKCIVHGCPAYLVVLVFHIDVK